MEAEFDDLEMSSVQAEDEFSSNVQDELPTSDYSEDESNNTDSGDYSEGTDEEEGGGEDRSELTSIDCVADFVNLNFRMMSSDDFLKHDFSDREVAFKFYNWYAKVKGFAARKDRIGKKGDMVVRQTFVFYRMGKHVARPEGYKKEPKRILRCGCKALCKVRLNLETQRWQVKELIDEHNHRMLEERFHGMLPRHRRMDVSDIVKMNDMREAGIGTPSIYQAFANQSGGFDRVGFRVRDMWIREMYSKRDMWATAYLRGTFFAGFRTTSRYIRQKEVEADFDSSNGEQLIHTGYPQLETSASLIYTRNVFLLFRRFMVLAAKLKVVGCKRSCACVIYLVRKHVADEIEWYVTFHPPTNGLKCSCKRMESYGLPCDHILAVMFFLDMKEVPSSIVLERWTKKAKDLFWRSNNVSPQYQQSLMRAMYQGMLRSCEEMCELVCASRFGIWRIPTYVMLGTQFGLGEGGVVIGLHVMGEYVNGGRGAVTVGVKVITKPHAHLGDLMVGSQNNTFGHETQRGTQERNECESFNDDGQMLESENSRLFSDDYEQQPEMVTESESESDDGLSDNTEEDFLG
ncbi:Zinc finger, PMZ-type [Sesbania bispinosa]|nr:Zinc finger, PMZ-type [Sesbania bispinosa]